MWTGHLVERVLIVPAHPFGCQEETRDIMASSAVVRYYATRQQGNVAEICSRDVFALVVHLWACDQNCCRYCSLDEDKLARTTGKWAGFEQLKLLDFDRYALVDYDVDLCEKPYE